MTDHEIAKQAFSSNHERLRAQRVAREATSELAAKADSKTNGN